MVCVARWTLDVPYDIDSMIGKVNEFEWEGGGWDELNWVGWSSVRQVTSTLLGSESYCCTKVRVGSVP